MIYELIVFISILRMSRWFKSLCPRLPAASMKLRMPAPLVLNTSTKMRMQSDRAFSPPSTQKKNNKNENDSKLRYPSRRVSGGESYQNRSSDMIRICKILPPLLRPFKKKPTKQKIEKIRISGIFFKHLLYIRSFPSILER